MIESQNSVLNKLVTEVAEIKKQNNEIKNSNKEIEHSLEFLNHQYEDMKAKVENLESERKQHLLRITSLETKLEEVERNLKAPTVEMRNVPITAQPESKATLNKIVLDTCKALEVGVQQNSLRDVYRINGKSGRGTVIAEFTSITTKNDVIMATKKYNKENPTQRFTSATIGLPGPATPIYISEAF